MELGAVEIAKTILNTVQMSQDDMNIAQKGIPPLQLIKILLNIKLLNNIFFIF